MNLESAPLPGLGANTDEPFVLLDDAVHRGEPQARALPEGLGGIEGLEDVLEHCRSHATPVIPDREQDIVPGPGPEVRGAVFRVRRRVSGLDADPAHTLDGIPGIDAEIGQELVDLGGVHADRPKARQRLLDQVDVLAQQPPEHL